MNTTTSTLVENTVPLPTDGRQTCSSMQWLLESPQDAHAPVFHNNTLGYFICGEDAFRSIAAHIKRAKVSIDIVCLGLDPAMELTRDQSTHWPRGETWASLLYGAATGQWNNGKPVQVRILSWFDFLGEMAAANMPGFVDASNAPLSSKEVAHMQTLLTPSNAPIKRTAFAESDKRARREDANALWYTLAKSGQLKSLSLRVRHGDSEAIQKVLSGQTLGLTLAERLGIEKLGTHHQKTILIDYDDTSPEAKPSGYVMGLNSLTDYWDTSAHLHSDPKRGEGWEGCIPNKETTLMPYQDYACRMEGEALVMLSKNFTEAWNKAGGGNGKGANLARTHNPHAPPRHLTQNLAGPRKSAQIVRTLPDKEGGENTIQRLYYQVATSARHYIYVENQYFQYAPWVKHLKEQRRAYADLHRKAGSNALDIPNLHLMVVLPTPERKQMVPRTHDAIKELGFGSSMPKQSEMLEAEIKRYKRSRDQYDLDLARYNAATPAQRQFLSQPRAPKLGDVAQTFMDSVGGQTDATIQKQLEKVHGLRALVASLWTYDHNFNETQKEGLAQLRLMEHNRDNPKDPQNPYWVTNTRNFEQGLIAQRFREIYIHSKLMIADDSMFTLGSANMNARSFATDGEINVATDCRFTSEQLRRDVWTLHSGGSQYCDGGTARFADMARAFKAWQELISNNGKAKKRGDAITGFLVPLLDERTSKIRLA